MMMSSHGKHWQRGKMIGKGRYGLVFQAFLKCDKFSSLVNWPQVMAVKSAELSASETIRHEAVVMFGIKGCPFIIEPLGQETTVGDNGELVYNLLLEYASGGTLRGMIKGTNNGCGLAEECVRDFTRSILEGIMHIHKCGYVHCDLKPENILLVPNPATRNGYVAKIADFGLARRTNRKCSRCRGTRTYLPPEAFVSNKQGELSDIWSLGCIVLEMLTGKPLWNVKNCPTRHDFKKLMDHALWSPEIPSSISPVARNFIRCCLALRTTERSNAEKLLSHPFITQSKLKAACSSLAECWFQHKLRNKFWSKNAASPSFFGSKNAARPPNFGIPAGL